jgi:hypothetical protein
MTKAEIEALIASIADNAQNKAVKVRNTFNAVLEFASDGQTLVFDGLIANNTSSSTTLVLDYGVNVIETSTPTDYACKLPQPVTGKRVIVVNMTGLPISLFPSNVGGQINNYPVNQPAIIPPDGRAYDFICIENPLPGAWVWSPPAIAQLEFTEIEVSHTNGVATNAVGHSTASLTFAGAGAGVSGGNLTLVGNFLTVPFQAMATRLKCYTNIVESDVGNFLPTAIEANLSTAKLTAANVGSLIGIAMQSFFGTQSFPEFGVQFIGTGTLNSPPEIGDTGTMFCNIETEGSILAKQIGSQVTGLFSSSYYTFRIDIPATSPTKDYKFKFFIEYF